MMIHTFIRRIVLATEKNYGDTNKSAVEVQKKNINGILKNVRATTDIIS